METLEKAKRISWLDFAKGIGILTVIISHTVSGYLRGVFFSFHMPFFFAISMVTYRKAKCSDDLKIRIRKLANSLLIPTLIVFLCEILLQNAETPESFLSLKFWVKNAYSLIMASGVEGNLLFTEVPALGALWFLVVLFFSKSLFTIIHFFFSERDTIVLCVMLSVLGVLLGETQPLPFSMDIVFAIMPFMLMGTYLINAKPEWKKIILCFFVWIVTLLITYPVPSIRSYLELAQRRYPMYPLCFICAACGSLLFIWISEKLCKIKPLTYLVEFLGRNSIYILCAHCLDTTFAELWGQFSSGLLNVLFRILFDIAGMMLILLLKKFISPFKLRLAKQV